MYKIFVVFAWALLSSCSSTPVEDSVVSVYTTQSTTAGTNPSLDVYHQIANNLAERITSPIYRFLGYNRTTSPPATTKPLWPELELLDDDDLTTKHELKPVDNEIEQTRDVEELSPGLMQPQKKPEKITLYSSLTSTYLPAKLAVNNSRKNEVAFDGLDLDDVDMDRKKTREGPFIYVMEFIGSVFQLIWGGLTSLFKPTSGSSPSR
ncbi:unnamed protein product [Arctia plantaginis]|uniref:Uncharacterized protein n=1 Tax=Arctia plantaginis TaxID=874455 RepID=A0A8S0YV79_ARCPL|nr:unnamed protein product [Arctia plantaginis]CAB3245550.1 unnamed protein product [Arctia plantaginis]